jgi:hypothetical protein
VSPGTSPEGKRTLFSLFRKNSVSEETSGHTQVDGRRVEFNDVDMAGKKKPEVE